MKATFTKTFSLIKFHFVPSTRVDAADSSSTQRLNQTPSEKSSFAVYKAVAGENPSKSNLNCILQNYTTNSLVMKNSVSGSEKDSMSDESADESDVDIVGDGMLC